MEFALILPFILMLVLVAIGVAALCVRGEVLSFAASRAARVAKVYQEDLVALELYATLTPEFVNRVSLVWSDSDGAERIPNWDDGTASIYERVNGAASFGALGYGRVIKRMNPVRSSLVPALSNGVLQGGDAPSPYCVSDEGYTVCGYPE